MFKNWNWINIWLSFLLLIATTAITGLVLWISSDKSTIRYSIGGNNKEVRLIREIDNYEDDYIMVDRAISLDSLTNIVEKLNKALKTKN